MNIKIINLLAFIIAQSVGIGMLANGSIVGVIPIFASLASGYIALDYIFRGYYNE